MDKSDMARHKKLSVSDSSLRVAACFTVSGRLTSILPFVCKEPFPC